MARLEPARLDARVRHECLRAFTNAMGCAVGGSRHLLVDVAAAALMPFAGAPQATLFGRAMRADVLTASLLNGLAGAAYSFDDTYSDAMLHASGPITAALLAVAEYRPVPGERLLGALAGGLEVACRLTRAVAVPPAEGELAWSQTGIACGIAAAMACAKLMALNTEAIEAAASIAATEAAGTRAAHGSMAASLIFGRAAQSGARSAVLAASGFTGAPAPLEGPHGFAATYARRPNLAAIVEGLGEQFELLANTYKPYPCGVVIHAALDGILQLRRRLAFEASDVEGIRLRVSPTAHALALRPDPQTDLEAKVSLPHWVAAAAVRGRAGLAEGTMAVVLDPAVRRLRALIEVVADPSLAQEAARVSVRMHEGAWHECLIAHASGSLACPMSDEAITEKSVDQAAAVLGDARASALIRACWDLPSLDDASAIARQAA